MPSAGAEVTSKSCSLQKENTEMKSSKAFPLVHLSYLKIICDIENKSQLRKYLFCLKNWHISSFNV